MNAWSRLTLITAGTATAVASLAETKTVLGITDSSQDTPIAATFAAALALIEGPYGIGVCIAPQTWQLSLDHFSSEISIPLGPVTAVTVITYRDSAGVDQTMTTNDWLVDIGSQPARLRPSRGATWPSALYEPGSVRIRFTAGFATIPAGLKHAALLTCKSLWRLGTGNSNLVRSETVDGVGSWAFASPESAAIVFDKGIDRLLEPYRVGRFG